MKISLLLLALILATNCCVTAQQTNITGPHAIVYKAKKKYHNLVPVVLSDDKSKIVSYPDPHDLAVAGSRLQPTALHKGYYLDNNGVGVNTVFIKMTYAEYAKLKQSPPVEALYKMIVNTNPLTALYDCGLKSGYKNPAMQMNQMIVKKTLAQKCTSLLNKK